MPSRLRTASQSLVARDTMLARVVAGGAREATSTARGREALDVLLKDLEHREQRERPAARFDVSWLRRELDLDDARK